MTAGTTMRCLARSLRLGRRCQHSSSSSQPPSGRNCRCSGLHLHGRLSSRHSRQSSRRNFPSGQPHCPSVPRRRSSGAVGEVLRLLVALQAACPLFHKARRAHQKMPPLPQCPVGCCRPGGGGRHSWPMTARRLSGGLRRPQAQQREQRRRGGARRRLSLGTARRLGMHLACGGSRQRLWWTVTPARPPCRARSSSHSSRAAAATCAACNEAARQQQLAAGGLVQPGWAPALRRRRRQGPATRVRPSGDGRSS